MSYEHHIFISYRRSDDQWTRWTKENFITPLRTLLRPALGNVQIFVDEGIESGDSWPTRLAHALSRSRLLVPVLSPDYFNSKWCRLELALMHDREKRAGFRCAGNPRGLIHPIIINDGHCFPPEVQSMQGQTFHDYANPFLKLDSPSQQALTEAIRGWCPHLEDALRSIPTFDPAWAEIAHDQFETLFEITTAPLTTVPSLTLHPTS